MSNKIDLYGLDASRFAKLPNQLEIELLYVATADPASFGGLSKEEHIKNVIRICYPWVWKFWHEWNELSLWAWCNYEEIGTTGCASAHKTFTFSLLSFIEWIAKPPTTSVILTSTTIGALRGRIWSEICKFYNTATIPFGYNVVDSMQKIQYKKGEDKFAIRGMAVASGDIEKAVGNIQGIHPERMIMVVDEAAQTPPAIFTARANLSTGTTLYRFVAIANAVDQFDAHGKFCEPKNGWSSVTVNDDHWDTKSGVCVHYDGLQSPNVRRKTTYFPRLFSEREIELNRTKFGENSLEWWSYVRGYWAPRGVRNTVLDAAMIFDGQADQKPIWETSGGDRYAALDPAFTTGGDRCILCFAKAGNFVDGKPGLALGDTVEIQLIESTEVPLNYQIADRVIKECMDRFVEPRDFIMDVTGASGLADIISQRWSNEINRVNFGGAPADGRISLEDRREAKQIYLNRVTQLWMNVARVVGNGRMRNLEAATSKEFCTRQYTLKGEKTVVESKKEMKTRTGGVSPDLADPVALLVDHFLKKKGFDCATPYTNNNPQRDWNRLIAKCKLKPTYS